MANRQKGEVSFSVNGTSYTVALTMDGQQRSEEAASTPDKEVFWDDIVRKSTAGSAKYSRLFLWALFARHHQALTLDEVGRLLDEAGGLAAVAALMQAAAKASRPEPRDVAELGGVTRPRTARVAPGTGGRSISRPGRRA